MNKELAIVLRATGATQTARDVAKVDSSISHLTSRAGTFATKLRGSVSGAVATFSGRIKGLIGATAGVLGVGGLLGLGVMFTNSIRKAQEWGASALRLSQLTKLPIETTSRLIDALDYFGVSAEMQTAIAGKFEKAIGAIAERSAKGATAVANWNKTHKTSITVSQRLALEYPKLAKFQKDYGLSLTDSKGHLLDWNKQLLVSADYFNNKSVPASKKALALSKLYGKSWQDMIPVLAQGRSGILKAEQDAMSMSQADLDAITKNKEATRAWDDAIGDLQTQIGIKLLPTLTDLMTGASTFINGHADEIVGFVKKAIDVARTAVGTITSVVSALGGLWDKIPAPLRDLLVKGLVADRAMKFLFGFSPAALTVKLGTDLLGGIAGAVGKSVAGSVLSAGIGKAFVQPVFVTNMGLGGIGGDVVGGAAAGGGLKGLAGRVFKLIIPVAIGWEIGKALGEAVSPVVTDVINKIHHNKSDAELGSIAALAKAAAELSEASRKNLQPTTGLTAKQRQHLAAERATAEANRIGRVTGQKTPDQIRMIWKPTSTIQIEDRRGEGALARVREEAERNRIALVSTTRTGDASIVGALRNLSFNFNLTVNGTRQLVRVQSGTTLHRVLSYNGKIVPQA